MKKTWNIPKIVKLTVSETANPGKKHDKKEHHNGSWDLTARITS